MTLELGSGKNMGTTRLGRIDRSRRVLWTGLVGIIFGPTIGCDLDETPTWNGEVQTLMERECIGCHYDGGIGPFPLVTYEDAALFAESVARSVREKRMPPWPPGSECMDYTNPRVLSEEEIQTIEAWAAAGSPEGRRTESRETVLSVPQLPWFERYYPEEEYVPNESVSDEYRCFVLPVYAYEDRYVIGYQIRPRTSWLVHHVNAMAAETDVLEDLDANDPGTGWDCIEDLGFVTDTLLGSWAPGTQPLQFPEGTGIMLRAGWSVVTQIHYSTANGSIEPDLTAVDLQYSDGPVAARAFIAPVSNTEFVIPPNSTDYVSTFTLPVPWNCTIWGIGGHMHQTGSRFRSSILSNGGADETCLLEIPRWDFNWQQGFFFDVPGGIPVTTDDILTLTCVWNNYTDHEVIWGDKTTDEMCQGFYYITEVDDDLPWL